MRITNWKYRAAGLLLVVLLACQAAMAQLPVNNNPAPHTAAQQHFQYQPQRPVYQHGDWWTHTSGHQSGPTLFQPVQQGTAIPRSAAPPEMPAQWPAQPASVLRHQHPARSQVHTYQNPAAVPRVLPTQYPGGTYYVEPGYVQPGYSQPGYAQPGYAQPEYVLPGYAQPGYAQPGYAQSGYVLPPVAPQVPTPYCPPQSFELTPSVNAPDINPSDLLELREPHKCNHECCEWVEEPYVDWTKKPCPVNWWEFAIKEEKQPFCKTDCPQGPDKAQCVEAYGMLVTKKLVKVNTTKEAFCLEPVVKTKKVRKCVRCGMTVAGGPFNEGAGSAATTQTDAADKSPQATPTRSSGKRSEKPLIDLDASDDRQTTNGEPSDDVATKRQETISGMDITPVGHLTAQRSRQ